MAVRVAGQADRAEVYKTSATALTSGNAGEWVTVGAGRFNISLWGGVTSNSKTAFTGTAVLERSFDGGATAEAVTYDDSTAVSWSNVQHSGGWDEDEDGVQYRIRCTAGSVFWRISQ